MQRIGRAISGLAAITSFIGSVFVILLVLHVTLDVALRYFFNAPLTGTILYVSLYYMTAIAFLPLAAVEERDAHISVELVVERLPSGIVRVLTGISLAITILIFLALAVRTFEEAVAKYEIGAFAMESGTNIPTWPTYFFLPVGFGLMLLVAVYKLACDVLGTQSGLHAHTHIADPGAPLYDE